MCAKIIISLLDLYNRYLKIAKEESECSRMEYKTRYINRAPSLCRNNQYGLAIDDHAARTFYMRDDSRTWRNAPRYKIYYPWTSRLTVQYLSLRNDTIWRGKSENQAIAQSY